MSEHVNTTGLVLTDVFLQLIFGLMMVVSSKSATLPVRHFGQETKADPTGKKVFTISIKRFGNAMRYVAEGQAMTLEKTVAKAKKAFEEGNRIEVDPNNVALIDLLSQLRRAGVQTVWLPDSCTRKEEK